MPRKLFAVLLFSFALIFCDSGVEVSAGNIAEFRAYPNSDLPGFDYRTPRNDSSLSGISKSGCISACAEDVQCRAFTYNQKAGWCFLKNGFRSISQFRGAFSGVKQSEAANKPVAGGEFRIMQSFDLPGFDYRSPRNDPSLFNTGVNGCMQACQRDHACKAFTYNRKENWCFLKKGLPRAKRFNIAVSGIKIKSLAVTPKKEISVNSHVEWPPSISEIRETAAEYGGKCEVENKQIQSFFDTTDVSPNAGSYEVGHLIDIEWKTENSDNKIPLYLMISFDQPVRFSGDGFYPLLPEAQAAFGIDWNKDYTRAIIPLFGSEATLTGQLQVHPLIAEPMNAEWAVVGYLRKCQQEVSKVLGTANYKIRPGQNFEVVLNEPASLVRPERTYISPNGKTKVEVFKSSYRLLDTKTGALIFEGAGTKPNYSPTGRFITIHTDENLNVIDTVDGKPLHKGGDVGWQNKDSYLITGSNGSGIQNIQFSVDESEKVYGSADGCRICRGLASGFSYISLEENIAYVRGQNSVRVFELPSKTAAYESAETSSVPSNAQVQFENTRAISYVNEHISPTKFILPSHEKFLQNTIFSRTLIYYTEGGGLDKWNKLITNSFLKPIEISQNKLNRADDFSENNDLSTIVRSTAWRSSKRSNNGISYGVVAERLSEISVKLMLNQRPQFHRDAGVMTKEYVREKPISEKEITNIINKIYLDVPKSRGAFSSVYSEYGCHSDNMNDLVRRFEQVVKYETMGRIIWITHNTCAEGSGAFNAPTLTIFDKDLKDGFQRLNLRESSNNIATECVSIDFCRIKVSLVSEKYIAFWTSESGGIAIYDIMESKVIFKKYNLKYGELIKDVFLLKDQNHLIQINSDNSFYIHRLRDGKQLLEGRIADEEAIVWASSGYYDATPEGAHFVSLKFPGRYGQYSFQQFERKLYSKEFVKRVLANQKLPHVTLTSPPSLRATFQIEGQDQVKLNVESNATGVGAKLKIYQDGLLTDQFDYSTDEDAGYSFKRLPGARWISAVVMDKDGLVSLPVGSDLGNNQSRKNKLHYLTVGINKYQKASNLKFGVSDAKNLAKALSDNASRSYELGETSTLHDEDANGTAIIEKLSKIVSSAELGDTIVFSFAGHGVRDDKGRFYIGTSKIDPADIPKTGLLWEKVVAILKRSKARILVFLDACHSGSAGTDKSIYATNDQVASDLLQTIPSGLVIFSASKGRELSEEDGKRGGVFTNALTDVITHKRSKFDTNKNGAIEISELYNGVKKEVVKNARGKQTPWLARNQMVGDFALF